MARAATYVTELLVGLACLGLGALAWRRGGAAFVVAAVALVVTGGAAVIHAAFELAQ